MKAVICVCSQAAWSVKRGEITITNVAGSQLMFHQLWSLLYLQLVVHLVEKFKKKKRKQSSDLVAAVILKGEGWGHPPSKGPVVWPEAQRSGTWTPKSKGVGRVFMEGFTVKMCVQVKDFPWREIIKK